MIAREEQEIVRGLIRTPPPKTFAAPSAPQPQAR
jgi:hypothetical protein